MQRNLAVAVLCAKARVLPGVPFDAHRRVVDMAAQTAAVALDAGQVHVHAHVVVECVAPTQLQHRRPRRLVGAGGGLHHFVVQRCFAADARMDAVIGRTQAHAEYVVAAADPPAVRRAAEVEVELAAHAGRGEVVVAAVGEIACHRFGARAVRVVVIERETLVVADQQIQPYARRGPVGVETKIAFQIDRAVIVAALVAGADDRIHVRVVAAHRQVDAIERRRLLGERRGSEQRQWKRQQATDSAVRAGGNSTIHFL